MDIGDRIRMIRGRRSRNDFAAELGIHPQTLYLYEKGKRVLDVDLVQQLCLRYNVSVEWLIFGEGELQSLREPADSGLEERLAEKEALLVRQSAHINKLKNELIAAQAGALKAYELAMGAIHPAPSAESPASPEESLDEELIAETGKIPRRKYAGNE